MIKVLIVEDEQPAVRRLKNVLNGTDKPIEITGVCSSVEETISWLNDNGPPDIGLFDIQLADGLSFEIFDYHEVDFPVVFVTAYNQYALKAFEVNGLDYLVKPVSVDDVNHSFRKLDKLARKWGEREYFNEKVDFTLAGPDFTNFKSRFLVKTGERLFSLPVTDIDFFYSFQKSTFCITNEGKKYLLDLGIDKVRKGLNPEHFFRINRQQIISFNAISDIVVYSNSRLKISLENNDNQELIVARERVKDFKNWLDR